MRLLAILLEVVPFFLLDHSLLLIGFRSTSLLRWSWGFAFRAILIAPRNLVALALLDWSRLLGWSGGGSDAELVFLDFVPAIASRIAGLEATLFRDGFDVELDAQLVLAALRKEAGSGLTVSDSRFFTTLMRSFLFSSVRLMVLFSASSAILTVGG